MSLPRFKVIIKQKCLSMSAKIVRVCMKYCYHFMSFEAVHEVKNRATLEKIMVYWHALMLHKIFNSNDQMTKWVNLNINQVFTSRQTKFKINKTNTSKIGLNALVNHLSILNDKIPLPLLVWIVCNTSLVIMNTMLCLELRINKLWTNISSICVNMCLDTKYTQDPSQKNGNV